MDKLLKFYINGEWVDPISTETMPVLNPASASQVASVALGNEADVDRAVAAAANAFITYSQTTKSDRLALLGRIREISERRFEELAQAMRMEMGPQYLWHGRLKPMRRLGTSMVLWRRSRRLRNPSNSTMVRFCCASPSGFAG